MEGNYSANLDPSKVVVQSIKPETADSPIQGTIEDTSDDLQADQPTKENVSDESALQSPLVRCEDVGDVSTNRQHASSEDIRNRGREYQPSPDTPPIALDPLSRRRIAQPIHAVARFGAIPFQASQQQAPNNATHVQHNPFQSTTPARVMSPSQSFPGPTPTMMPHMQQQMHQPIQQLQQMQPMMHSHPPPAPMALPLHDEVALVAHQLSAMSLAAQPRQRPHLRRQSAPDPHLRALHPQVALFLNSDLLEELEDFDRELEEMLFHRQIGRGHRGPEPVLMHSQLLETIHRDYVNLNANALMMNNAVVVYNQAMGNQPMVNSATINSRMIGHPSQNAMVNPSVVNRMMPLHPFSYEIDPSPMAGMYPTIHDDLKVLSTITQMQDTTKIKPLLAILIQRSPTEIDTLRKRFRTMNGGTDLETAFSYVIRNERQSVKYAIMGLALGPVLFDLWLVQTIKKGDNDDILIDIFIGRHADDIKYLLFKFYQQQQATMTGRSMSSVLDVATSNDILRKALDIAIESTRPNGHYYVVNELLVLRDTDEISRILKAGFLSATKLFNILLRRSDEHLMRINNHYRLRSRDQALDEAIRRCAAMDKMTRKIAIHAVRSATDPTYRDVMSLRDALGSKSLCGNGNNEKLAIRMCRLHWYKEHWRQVKAAYMRHNGRNLVDKVNGRSGLLKDVLVAMCSV